MPSSRGASRGPGKQQQQHSSMEATVVDFDAAMQVMEEEKTKRTLQRGGSGAGPPVAKARSAPMDLDPSQTGGGAAASASGTKVKTAEETPVPDGKDQDIQSDEEVSLKQLMKLVKKMDVKLDQVTTLSEKVAIVGSKMDNLASDMKDLKCEYSTHEMRIQELETLAKQAKDNSDAVQKLDDAIEELKRNIAEGTKEANTNKDYNWPRLGEGSGRPSASASVRQQSEKLDWPGQDQLVLGGFPSNTSKRIREDAAKMVLNRLGASARDDFEYPVALFETGRIALLKKQEYASWSCMARAITQYEKNPLVIKLNDKEHKLWLGRNKRPERRKRNTVLRGLAALAEQKGATEVDICWWPGDLRSKGKRLATVRDSGEMFFVTNPCIDETIAKEHLEQVSRDFRRTNDWP